MLHKNKELAALAPDNRPEQGGDRAIVVFRDTTEIRWLRFLKRGFRHCAVLIEVETGWIVCDALSHKTYLKHVDNENTQIFIDRLCAVGLHGIQTRVKTPPARMAPILPYTCVEGVKRILGIHAWSILTPWQLYQYLIRSEKNMFDKTPNTEY